MTRLHNRNLPMAVFWIAVVVIGVSSIAIRSGHQELLWVILRDCGIVVWVLALTFQGYFYWRRRKFNI
jgi:hypothetical protein